MKGFHGTNGVAAVSILHEGIRPWCFWAFHPFYALKFGGPHLFIAEFDKDTGKGTALGNWQFLNQEWIPPGELVYEPPR